MTDRPQPVDPRLLLAEEDFLRALVRALLANTADVDDVVQGAWLRALETGPADRSRLRRWLARVALNLARDRHRQDARRSALERACARKETTPSATEVLEHEERRGKVVAAVVGLPSPYRDVLLLRYYEGLEPRRIARRLDVPGNTVRSWLHRAHAMVREQLEQDFGDRRRARLALVALATWPPARSVPRLPLVAAATLLVVTGGLVWGLRIGASPRVAGRASSAAPVAGALVARPASPPVRRTLENAPVTRLRLCVRARDDGDVVPRVPVVVALAGQRGGPPFAQRRIHTDARGIATLELPRSSCPAVWTLRVDREDLLGTGRVYAAPDASDVVADLVVLALTARLTGIVTDEAGNPVADATVRWGDRFTTRTDRKGAYACAVPPWPIRVEARADGFVAADSVAHVVGHEAQHDLRLAPARTITGRITGPRGDAVAGAVLACVEAGPWPVRAGEDGGFTLDVPAGAGSVVVQAAARGWAPVVCRVRTDSEVRIVLLAGITVHGTVRGANGRPLAGARLFARRGDLAHGRPIGTTDAGGSFRIDGLTKEDLRLAVRAPGYALGFAEIPAEPPRHLTIHLDPSVRLAGTVRAAAAGRPLGGAAVRFALPDGTDLGGECITRPDGTFTTDELPLTDVRVTIDHHGHRPATRIVFPGAGRADFSLARSPHIAGRVVDAASGAPVTAFRLHLVRPRLQPGEHAGTPARTWHREGHAFVSADGRWTTGGGLRAAAPSDLFAVEVVAPGYASAVLDRLHAAADGSTANHVVRLTRGSELSGELPATEPAGTRVLLRPAAGERARRPRMTVTDATGRFCFEHVAAGHYEIGPLDADGNVRFVRRIEAPQVAMPTDLAPPRGDASIAGRCESEGPVPDGVRVVLMGDGPYTRYARTEDGRFRFENIPAGSYRLRVRTWRPRAATLLVAEHPLRVAAGEAHRLALAIRLVRR